MRKLQSQSGETITEVLIASLIVVLGVLLFSTMVSSSFQIMTTAERKLQSVYEAESSAEQKTDSYAEGEFNVELGVSYDGFSETGDGSYSVNLYGSPDDGITSFGKAGD